jgi:hypothetical protein
MLTVFDCLTVFEETFLVGETRQGTVNLHPDVWGMKDEYTLCNGEEWKETSGWWYRWYDSGQCYCTENEYCGSFETAQESEYSVPIARYCPANVGIGDRRN